MSITFQEIKTPSQMREKDFTRLGSKIMFVKTMHNFWPCCTNCDSLIIGFGCYHKKARIGYIVEINKENSQPIIRWRKDKLGICKYYEHK